MDRAMQAQLENDPVLQAATEWFFELRTDEVSGERVAEWQQWLAADAAHRDAFRRVEAFWPLSRQAQNVRWPADQEVAADAYEGGCSISEWKRTSSRRFQSTHFALAASVAAVALTLALAWAAVDSWPRIAPMIFGTSTVATETNIGEMRTVRLADGSSIVLGGRTTLTANLTHDSRDIVLQRGEAYFQVAKDPARPFTVHSGTTSVVAVGTAFNVRRVGERTVVAVAEGKVRVAAGERAESPVANLDAGSSVSTNAPRTMPHIIRTASLHAGQQLSVDAGGGSTNLATVDANSVAGWRDGRLQYINEPLATVVADLARYSSREIHVANDGTRELRVTGIVFQDNIDGWLASLQSTLPLNVVHEEGGAVRLEGRRSPSDGRQR